VYAYCLHGGTIPAPYLELMLMRDLGIRPWEIDRLSAGQLLEILACLEGEALAAKVRQEAPGA
jgi:hypothetical protein